MRPNKIDIIYNADCARLLNDEIKFPTDSIDLIVTSPPYAEQRKNSYGGIAPNKYVEWFLPITKQLQRTLKPSGSFILNIKENVKDSERQTYVLELILALKKQDWLWIEEYCWYKKNSFPGLWPNRFRDSWERCLHFTKNKKFNMYQEAVKVPIGDWAEKRFKSMSQSDYIRSISGTNNQFARNVSNWLNKKTVNPHNVLVFEEENYFDTSNILNFATECSNRNHSAVFPIQLPDWFIKLFTKEGDIVLDPFVGIGTTAIAAKLLNRRFIGIELIEEYVKEGQKNINELIDLNTKSMINKRTNAKDTNETKELEPSVK